MFDLGTIVHINKGLALIGLGPQHVKINRRRYLDGPRDGHSVSWDTHNEKAFNRRVVLFANAVGLPLDYARRVLLARDPTHERGCSNAPIFCREFGDVVEKGEACNCQDYDESL
jgi:hypothetical protein